MMANRIAVYDPGEQVGAAATAITQRWSRPCDVAVFDDIIELASALGSSDTYIALVVTVTGDPAIEFARLQLIRDAFPAVALVLVAASLPRLEPAALVRVGAIELVELGSLATELPPALERAVDIGARKRRQPVEAERPARRGRVIAVVSAAGGVGRTLVASNAAAWLHRHAVGSVCLIDLSGPFGAVATALRLRPAFTVPQACRAATELIDREEEMMGYLVAHPHGFDVLASGDDPADWEDLVPSSAGDLIDLLAQRYDAVVIDCPAGYGPLISELITKMTDTVVMGTLDVHGIRGVRLLCRELDRLGADPAHLHLVMNHVMPGVGLDADRIGRYLPIDFRALLPVDPRVRRSMNAGRICVVDDPGLPLAEELTRLFGSLGWIDGMSQPITAPTASDSKMWRWSVPRLRWRSAEVM